MGRKEGAAAALTLYMGRFVILLDLFWFSFLNILYIMVSMKKCICKQTSVWCSPSEDRVCLNSSPLLTDFGNHPRQSSSP